jgi:hypothetical protein
MGANFRRTVPQRFAWVEYRQPEAFRVRSAGVSRGSVKVARRGAYLKPAAGLTEAKRGFSPPSWGRAMVPLHFWDKNKKGIAFAQQREQRLHTVGNMPDVADWGWWVKETAVWREFGIAIFEKVS